MLAYPTWLEHISTGKHNSFYIYFHHNNIKEAEIFLTIEIANLFLILPCYAIRPSPAFSPIPQTPYGFPQRHFLLQLVPSPTPGTKLSPTSFSISCGKPMAQGPHMAPTSVSCGLSIKLRQELGVLNLAVAWPDLHFP